MDEERYAAYNEYLNTSENIQYYIDNPDEYEWFKSETNALKQYCVTHKIPLYKSRYSLKSFIHPMGCYSSIMPTENVKEQIDWYIHWHRIYDNLVQRHTAHLKYLKEREERELENKIYDAIELFWDMLLEHNTSMYWQFKRNQNLPHVAAEIKNQQKQFVYSLLYEGKNLFEPVV